jgi:hypothetical protein
VSFAPKDLAALVQTMRDLGVVQAFGVVLGPEPPKVVKLAAEMREATPERAAQLAQEVAAELREARIREALDEVRDKLAATGREYTYDELKRFIPPERWAAIEAMDA